MKTGLLALAIYMALSVCAYATPSFTQDDFIFQILAEYYSRNRAYPYQSNYQRTSSTPDLSFLYPDPATQRWQEIRSQCEALEEYAIAEDIREILRQEQEHQTDLATALGEDPPDVSRKSRSGR